MDKNPNQCQYCHKVFQRSSSLQVHLCEPKRRRQQQHDRDVQIGFNAYLRFFEITQGSAVKKTFDDFADSPYYRAFVTFGRYCTNIRAISPEHYVKWLLDNNKKLDQWARDSYYDQYLSSRLLEEPMEQALSRGIEFAMDWAEENHSQAQDFFRYGNGNRVMYAVTTGRVSAWIIYNCDSGQEFLDSLNSDSVVTLWPYIDSDRWQRKFANYAADREYCREILAQAGW